MHSKRRTRKSGLLKEFAKTRVCECCRHYESLFRLTVPIVKWAAESTLMSGRESQPAKSLIMA